MSETRTDFAQFRESAPNLMPRLTALQPQAVAILPGRARNLYRFFTQSYLVEFAGACALRRRERAQRLRLRLSSNAFSNSETTREVDAGAGVTENARESVSGHAPNNRSCVLANREQRAHARSNWLLAPGRCHGSSQKRSRSRRFQRLRWRRAQGVSYSSVLAVASSR